MKRRDWLKMTAVAPILAYFGIKTEPRRLPALTEEEIRRNLTRVRRVSDTEITVTFPPYAGYSIIDDEVITFAVPRSALL